MKYLKRAAYVFVFCLALVGVFALLKKAPQLHIPEEDKGYLEEVFGGVKFDGNGQASQGGLSSLMDHGVEGAPPVSSSLSGASAAPPSSFGSDIAPAFGSNVASTEAPAFENPISEAPAFQASNTNLPELNVNTPFAATVAPQYGSQFQAPIAPVTKPASNTLLEAPPFEATPKLEPVPSTFVPEPNPSPPLSVVPPSWDGPATRVDSIPSSVSAEPRGDFGVSGHDVFAQNLSTSSQKSIRPEVVSSPILPTTTDSVLHDSPDIFSSEQISTNPFSVIPSSTPQQMELMPVPAISASLPKSPNAEAFNGIAETISEQPTNGVEAIETKTHGTVFVKPQFKRLPQVPESISVVNILPKPTEEPKIEKISQQDIVPNDYQQTSMRNTMVLAPMRRNSPDEAPKVSFAQQTPKAITSTEPTETKTLIVSPPEIVETETRPFVEPKTEHAQQQQAMPPFPVIKELASINTKPVEKHETDQNNSSNVDLVQTMPMVHPAIAAPAVSAVEPKQQEIVSVAVSNEDRTGTRDAVGRFIDAQYRAFESGDPERTRSAYVQLSRLYDHKELNESERAHLKPILDRMGLEIIFSCKQHVLEPAYTVKAGDTIDSIASFYRISPALLMKINGLTGARPLKPGSMLKVVFGQFDARVSVSKNEMTLILGGLYAGRFSVTIGKEIRDLRGDFVVTLKDESFRGNVLTLNNGITLRSDNSTENSLRFSERDANELFDILTQSSVITLEN